MSNLVVFCVEINNRLTVRLLEQIPPMQEEFEVRYNWNELSEQTLKKHFMLPPQLMQKELMDISEFLNCFADAE